MPHIAAAYALAILFAGQGASSVPTRDVRKLAWLQGCWEGTSTKRAILEQWMRPDGGTLLGIGRTVADGRTLEYEFMRIWEDGQGDVFFTAKPSGQDEASFKMIELTDSSVVFENRDHDFPQRISYRRDADGGLLARIEGTSQGKALAIDFPMRRGTCGE